MSRPKVAFFDFTSCEGCQLSKLNLEEDLLGILELVELVNFREAISDGGTTTRSRSWRAPSARLTVWNGSTRSGARQRSSWRWAHARTSRE